MVVVLHALSHGARIGTSKLRNHANNPPPEVDRAAENLAKSGKPFGPGFPPQSSGGRRESMPMSGGGGAPRAYPEYGTIRRPIYICTHTHTGEKC